MDIKKRLEKRKKRQQRAVVFIICASIVAVTIAFFAARNLYFSDPSAENISDAMATGTNRSRNLQGEIERFFGGVRDSAWARNGSSQWIIELEPNARPLADIIAERIREEGYPLDYTWRGPVQSRWFMEGDSLKDKAEQLATEESVYLIWWLDKDYIVRATFEVYSDLVNSLDRLARSLNAQHADQVEAYLCPRARAILIAGSEDAALVSSDCRAVSSLPR
ncbi:TcpQ domain-containing protein [Aliidiomarina celeris]|uniref:TcpQ domain-containing protein n=1 Tax=Aliidiomarina celeris TaxID=2249428 RepID=UPI000DEAFF1A|nr:TcpQ domain-containing protein [Aliidiomarina celeris]